VAGWATFTAALQTTRDAIATNTSGARWGTRFFVGGDPPELVGWGDFKGPPADGIIELGYEIAEARRGRGLATAATRAMLAEAFSNRVLEKAGYDRPDARVGDAHTLTHRNASNRVLQKAGFHHDAETVQDGEVIWRFSVARPGRA